MVRAEKKGNTTASAFYAFFNAAIVDSLLNESYDVSGADLGCGTATIHPNTRRETDSDKCLKWRTSQPGWRPR